MPKSPKRQPAVAAETPKRRRAAGPPTVDAIAGRAYELFVQSGAQHGRDLEHWLQAEEELRARSSSRTTRRSA